MDNFDFIFDNFTEEDFKKVRINPHSCPNPSTGASTEIELRNRHGDPRGHVHRQEVQLGARQQRPVQPTQCPLRHHLRPGPCLPHRGKPEESRCCWEVVDRWSQS